MGLHLLEHARQRDVRSPVEDQANSALVVELDDEDDGPGEVGIGQVALRDENLAAGQLFDWTGNQLPGWPRAQAGTG